MTELLGFEPPRMNWFAADLPNELQCFKQYLELIFSGPFADKDEAHTCYYGSGRKVENVHNLGLVQRKQEDG